MQEAGEITIELSHRGGSVDNVKLNSTRPVTAARVLIGKTPEQVLTMVPLLFSLCGNAQTDAALLACRAALHLEADTTANAAREILVNVETLREHGWRILLDWPPLIGMQADKTGVAALLKSCAGFAPLLFRNGAAFELDSVSNPKQEELETLATGLRSLIDSFIFGDRLRQFRSINDEDGLLDWLDANDALAARLLKAVYGSNGLDAGRNNVHCLPELDIQALFDMLQNHDLTEFSRAPHWQNTPYETTPLSRQQSQPLIKAMQSRYGNGLIVRFLATLSEVAALTEGLGEETLPCSKAFGLEEIGLAQVQAARGLLLHRVVLRHGRVYDYHIVAPTEWNFHPEGVAANGLRRLRANDGDGLRRQAHWLIQAIDPCVQFKLAMIAANSL
ncbi:MAG: Ni,Fe-hydrogenase I large subunit [Methylomonas sp.]|nr:Ni,Fe-hydrogenase I large subunit [Methylomonas sp.]